MFSFESIAMLYKLEIAFNHFSPEDTKMLMAIADDIEKLVVSRNPISAIRTIKRFYKLEKDFGNKFEQLGGNVDRLNQKIMEFNKSIVPGLAEAHKIVKRIS